MILKGISHERKAPRKLLRKIRRFPPPAKLKRLAVVPGCAGIPMGMLGGLPYLFVRTDRFLRAGRRAL
jgi:hypothetical protein